MNHWKGQRNIAPGVLTSTTVLYSQRDRFETRLEYQLSWIRISVVFLKSTRRIPRHYLQIDYGGHYLLHKVLSMSTTFRGFGSIHLFWCLFSLYWQILHCVEVFSGDYQPCEYGIGFQRFEAHLSFHHQLFPSDWSRDSLRNVINESHTHTDDRSRRLNRIQPP
jgi:hypothetical protein